jgi:hypothetical protein
VASNVFPKLELLLSGEVREGSTWLFLARRRVAKAATVSHAHGGKNRSDTA